MPSPDNTSVIVQGDNLGTINTGTVQSLRNHVQSYQRSGQVDVARHLEQLVEAIKADTTLPVGERQEALELVDGLAAEHARPTAERRPSILRSLGAGVDAILSRAPQLAALWPMVKDLLGK